MPRVSKVAPLPAMLLGCSLAAAIARGTPKLSLLIFPPDAQEACAPSGPTRRRQAVPGFADQEDVGSAVEHVGNARLRLKIEDAVAIEDALRGLVRAVGRRSAALHAEVVAVIDRGRGVGVARTLDSRRLFVWNWVSFLATPAMFDVVVNWEFRSNSRVPALPPPGTAGSPPSTARGRSQCWIRVAPRGRAKVRREGVVHPGREAADGIVVVVQRQADLLQVVGALHPIGGLAHLLHRRQQHADQDADDGDDHQQLDQGKSPTLPRFPRIRHRKLLPGPKRKRVPQKRQRTGAI